MSRDIVLKHCEQIHGDFHSMRTKEEYTQYIGQFYTGKRRKLLRNYERGYLEQLPDTMEIASTEGFISEKKANPTYRYCLRCGKEFVPGHLVLNSSLIRVVRLPRKWCSGECRRDWYKLKQRARTLGISLTSVKPIKGSLLAPKNEELPKLLMRQPNAPKHRHRIKRQKKPKPQKRVRKRHGRTHGGIRK